MNPVKEQLLLFQAFAAHARAIVAAKDLEGRYIYANPEYCRMVGKTEEECLGHTDDELLPPSTAQQSRLTDAHVIRTRETVHIEETAPVEGHRRHYLSVRFPIHDEHGNVYATGQVSTEITECKRLQDKLRAQAELDSLTGCYNRRKLFELAESEIRRAARYHYALTVMMLDVDNFKSINDSYGHAAGDRVITGIAELCRNSLRENDMLARLGGDEFVILLPHTKLREGMELARRIRQRINQWSIDSDDGRAITVTTSIGVAQKNATLVDFDQLLGAADAALYQAKKDGRNCIRPHLKRWLGPGLSSIFSVAGR